MATFFFFLRVKFDEESIGDDLEAQKILLFYFGVFSGAVATALKSILVFVFFCFLIMSNI